MLQYASTRLRELENGVEEDKTALVEGLKSCILWLKMRKGSI